MKLVWTATAFADLHHIAAYIAEHNAAAASAVIQKIAHAAEQLTQYPELGRDGRVKTTRELVIPGTPFIVAYRSKNNEIHILSVLHASRRWPEKL